MNTPDPLPTPDHFEISISVIAIGLVMTTIGLLCFLSPFTLLPGILIAGWGGSVVWFQYLATFRRDLHGALLIGIQCSLATLALLGVLGLWIALRYEFGGMRSVYRMATWIMFIGAIVAYGVWVTVANWRWYLVLRKATQQGLTTPPWRQLSIGDLMALMVMIGAVLGMMSFLFRSAAR
ncbi:hypothetical protein [Blastopirellula marina]|uniref:Uncharacterized protein n=1 Tax=Blastopirellula marina TaxID=124 RepID=A0A2S8F6N8_9BACT|nr:hypothetical protein [Blastopirellula marina]PQO27829.1 hypothetical protein C5Y98_26225 [Blastopirellula marina]PTL41564.1 hypothetical protein C5Y97_26240 [Blastopirellula marina]